MIVLYGFAGTLLVDLDTHGQEGSGHMKTFSENLCFLDVVKVRIDKKEFVCTTGQQGRDI
jgi:hypothetical protein